MRTFLIITLVFSFVSPSFASDPPAVSETVIVTASAIEEDPERTPAAVTVITREDIERKKARDLTTLLREVPGLSVSRSGTEGKQTSMFIRGANSAHALVLWNGIEINNAYSGGFDWGQFSTAGVTQVEIVRGPYSAIYGSDAMAGVVNVITGQRPQGFTVVTEAGERGLAGARLDGAWTAGSLAFDGALDSRRDDGFHDNDDFEQVSALGALTWRGADGLSVGLAARFNDFELGIPFNVSATGLTIEPSLDRRQSGRELQVSVPVRQVLGSFEWNLGLSRSDRRDEFSDPQDPFGYTSSTTESVVDRAALSTRTSTRIGTIVAGAEWEQATVDDRNAFNAPGEWNLESRERESHALFVENRMSRAVGRAGLELIAGVRFDEYDTFGSHVSPKIAVALLVGAGKVRAAWGEGFRAPALTELYFPFYGNETLDPERSTTWEIGYDHAIGSRGAIGVTLFESEYDNLIVFDNATFAFANAGAADVRGIELGSRWRSKAFHAAASWTWLDTKKLATGRPLERRPENSGSLSIGWSRGAFTSEVTTIHSGARLDVQPVLPYGIVTADAWTTVDIVVEYALGPVRPYLRVENALDAEYEEVLGYPSASRRALIGARWTLK